MTLMKAVLWIKLVCESVFVWMYVVCVKEFCVCVDKRVCACGFGELEQATTLRLSSSCVCACDYRSLLQNIVSFIGLFCKRDV